MKRSLSLVLVGFVLVACRGIVGIEDQTVGDASAAIDAGTDARTDAGSDSGSDSGRTDSCSKQQNPMFPDCGHCCHEAYKTEFDPLAKSVRSNCICGKGLPTTCATQCTVASGDCGSGMVSQTCAPCIDEAVADGTCPDVTCPAPGCANLLACLRGCR